MTRKELQHRAEYALARAFEASLGRLPRPTGEWVGRGMGSLLQWPIRLRADLVDRNLERAFPEKDERWRRGVARESYRHLGREVTAMLHLPTLDAATVRDLVEVPDGIWAEFEEALTEGRGAILATGHYGNWEMAAAGVAARGVPIDIVVKRQSNRLIDSRIAEARRALGVGTIRMGRARREIPQALATGRTVGIAADQDAHRSGVWVPFFGVPASTYRGPALLALRHGAPLFAAVCRRLPDGRYRLDGRRIPVERTGSLEADVVRIMTMISAHLESEIRSDPGQYLWLHNRWKTAPPEEPVLRDPGTTPHGGREAAAS